MSTPPIGERAGHEPAQESHTDPDATHRLPFFSDVDCALGIAVKSYLDELSSSEDATSAQTREQIKTDNMSVWFPHAVDFSGDLQRAFKLWDAVSPDLARTQAPLFFFPPLFLSQA